MYIVDDNKTIYILHSLFLIQIEIVSELILFYLVGDVLSETFSHSMMTFNLSKYVMVFGETND
jgi:hypothetical protein